MTEADVYQCIRAKYPPPEYVTMRQVANGTGVSKRRYADAVSLSTFPSKGLYLTGFEIKVARGDWIKELSDPEKSDEIGRYCDFWYIVTDRPGIIFPGELPPMWGHYTVDGASLKVVKRCQQRTVDTPSLSLLAAMLRRAFDASPEAEHAVALNKKYHEGVDYGYKQGLERGKQETDRVRKQLEELMQAERDFAEVTGQSLQHWNRSFAGEKTHATRVAEAVRLVMGGGLHQQLDSLRQLRDSAFRIAEFTSKAVDDIIRHEGHRHARRPDAGDPAVPGAGRGEDAAAGPAAGIQEDDPRPDPGAALAGA